ncbi:hypothetical protein [Nostoc sp.]
MISRRVGVARTSLREAAPTAAPFGYAQDRLSDRRRHRQQVII